MATTTLTDKQKLFCDEYLVSYNATDAARKAGYAKKQAGVIAWQNLQKPLIQEYLQARKAAIQQKLEISQERTMLEIGRLAFSDIRKYFTETGELRPLHELDDDAAAALASVETEEVFDGTGKDKVQTGLARKIKTYDKTKALEMLAKHYKIFEEKPPGDTNITIQFGYGKEE